MLACTRIFKKMSQSWNINIWYFLSQKCRLRAVSRKNEQIAWQADPAVYPVFRSEFWWFLSDFRIMISTWKLAFILHINILPIARIGQLLYSFRLKIVNKAIMGKWEKSRPATFPTSNYPIAHPLRNYQNSYFLAKISLVFSELFNLVFLCKDLTKLTAHVCKQSAFWNNILLHLPFS